MRLPPLGRRWRCGPLNPRAASAGLHYGLAIDWGGLGFASPLRLGTPAALGALRFRLCSRSALPARGTVAPRGLGGVNRAVNAAHQGTIVPVRGERYYRVDP